MDQIADLLTRIKNAASVRKFEVVVSFSKMKKAILDILKNEGFISDIELVNEEGKQLIKIVISNRKMPTHLRQISKPGRRIYVKCKEMPKPLRGLGTVVVSTPAGVTSGRDAVKKGLGGELICEIW